MMILLRHPLSLLAICLLILVGVLRSYSPPSPLGADIPDVEFSAVRADAILRDLLAENVPHVSGSPANAVVRDRIVAQLESFGYEPQIQSRYHCNPMFGSCSPVENIIALKPGTTGKDAVLLTAHYDSAWAGPGAADDGAGTAAILEIARMSADFPPFENDIVFLISDSEENGLIGADAFAEHHPLFPKVKAVINLEARGVSGPSGLFETGNGNRRVLRMFANAVERPTGSSLVYEIYKQMPNDTDYTVYKRKGVMGVNFAFAQGVPVYHSAIDDPDHLDMGSLQHHGDNAWGMMKAFGERNLDSIFSREDGGYIDVFGSWLIHYPASITQGLALILGVWVMLAIGLAFRKVFRFRQLRWGLLAVPFLLLAIALGGYLLSWPLGHWPDLHPLEHPAPWAGRLALLLMVFLAGYTTLKLFTGRVSACAWMIIAWALVFVLGMKLTSYMPTAAHIALLPLAAFALGSIVDLFRKKSRAPLLVASVLGFAGASFISFYHFFMLDVVMNFDQSLIKSISLWMMALVAMPMLLAFASEKELSWQPARWLLVTITAVCLVHLFISGYSSERPRDMTLMYSGVEGEDTGYVVLESLNRRHDRKYAEGHAFEMKEVNSGRLDTVRRPVREVDSLDLPGIQLEQSRAGQTEQGFIREFEISVPGDGRFLRLAIPKTAGLEKAWINGELALDHSLESKHKRTTDLLQVMYPRNGQVKLEMQMRSADPFTMAAVTWHELPGILLAPFMGNWPDDARPVHYGRRAENIQEFEFGAIAALPAEPP